MLRALLALPFVIAFVAAAEAVPIAPQIQIAPSVELVADDCGANKYRGPGGACHRYGTGPYPGGYYGRHIWGATSCPPGYWRGPWGHCRDTPYHGGLPGGGWKP
jgi:hypothetical protein